MGRRSPLSGTLTIEWVDAANPSDASEPPSFGWSSCKQEPSEMEPERLLVLLRALTTALEEDLSDGSR